MQIKFNTENAAFDYGRQEIARILREIADSVEIGRQSAFIIDINGNKVGRWSL